MSYEALNVSIHLVWMIQVHEHVYNINLACYIGSEHMFIVFLVGAKMNIHELTISVLMKNKPSKLSLISLFSFSAVVVVVFFLFVWSLIFLLSFCTLYKNSIKHKLMQIQLL